MLLLLLASVAMPSAAREPVVGLPCEGCEAVFEAMPARPPTTARIAPANEPGQPMTVTGRVLDSRGRGQAGVVVYAYQTDAHGTYPRARGLSGAAARHGRLRGWALSGPDGRYTFQTIRPAVYPSGDTPAHIHMHVIERGCATYYIDDVMFTDDPLLTPDQRRSHARGRGGEGIATPTRRDGRWQVTRDIRLGQEIPGYPACGAGRAR